MGGVKMAVDMSLEPWLRLIKLAPPNTSSTELQTAADRYGLTADLYAACADLWEEAAAQIDLTPDVDDSNPATPTVQSESVSQDGISKSTTYARGTVGLSYNQRLSQVTQYNNKARYYRSKAKPKTALLDGRYKDRYDPEIAEHDCFEGCFCESIIPVI